MNLNRICYKYSRNLYKVCKMSSTKYLIVVALLASFVQLSESANIFSNAKFSPKCKKVGPTQKLDMDWALELFVGKKFYLPMGSQSAFEDLTELLSGTRASGQKDLDEMCVEVTTKGFKSSVEGYDGRYMIIDCALVTKGVQDCSANPRTEFPDRHKSVNGMQTLAWTDNKSSVILVRCSPNGDKNDWVLYSTNSTISEDAKKTILEQVTNMGFPASDFPIHFSDYSGCNLSQSED